MSLQITEGITFGSGVNISIQPPNLMLHLDAGNPSSYPGSGATWTDLVASRIFTLYNSPVYSGANGGSLQFIATSGNYGQCSSSLPNLNRWTVEVWHYYNHTNAGVSPSGQTACIITEVFPGPTLEFNYAIGNMTGTNPNYLYTGFYDGVMETTGPNISLIPGTWNQIIGTFNGSEIKLYINNTLVSRAFNGGTPISSQAGIRLMRNWDTEDYWGGNLSIVKIYDGDIGVAGVRESWNLNRSRFGL